MKTCAGKVMVSINDHPDIRQCFDGLSIYGLDVTYSVSSNNHGAPTAAKELCITNWNAGEFGGLFDGH